MDVQLSKAGQVLVAKPLGRWLDGKTSSDLRRVVACEIEKGERFVVLDLSQVTNIDSAGLGTLVGLLKLVPEGGRLVLGGSPPVRQLLERARLDHLLVSFPTDADAIASFSSSK